MLRDSASDVAISVSAASETAKSLERLSEKTDSIAKLRLEFFDRIVFLDGGTVALSVTLFGSFASKTGHVMVGVWLLILSWSAFLLSMVLALTRNWFEHDRLAKRELTNVLIAIQQSLLADLSLGRGVSGPSPEVQQLEKVTREGNALYRDEEGKHKSLASLVQFVGIASLSATLLGFGFLLWFAIKNVPSV